MINILITDDHPILRKGLRQLLEDDKHKRFGFIDEAVNGSELIEKLISFDFNIVLLDISLPGRNGLELLSDIRKIKPDIPVLMLSTYSEDQYAIRALKLGASGYLTKATAAEELIAAVVKVAGGSRYITASLAEKITYNFFDEPAKPLHGELSVRELEVTIHLASGKTMSNIAKELSLSPNTISKYRERILAKLKLKTTSDIIRYAINEGLV